AFYPFKTTLYWNYWRTGWDSNPRNPCRFAAFRVRCHRPLDHLSTGRNKGPEREKQVAKQMGSGFLKKGHRGFGRSPKLTAFAVRNGPLDHFVRCANHSSPCPPAG